MQEFFMDYGLWLLVGMLIVIGIVFLLSSRRKPADIARAEPPETLEREVASGSAVEAVPAVAAAEPLAPTVEPAVAPVPAPPPVTPASEVIPISPAVTAAPADQRDDLLKLKGIGPKLNALLIELGVTRYAQIAEWSDADIAAIDARLGNFKGRPVRDQWVDQARYLAAGDLAGFEAKYGKL